MNISLTHALRRFVDEQVESGRYLDGREVVRTALRRMEAQEMVAFLGATGDGDVIALACIVMMEAAKSAREDLEAIMAGVKAINQAKRGMRELIGKVQRDVAANAGCRAAERALDFSRGLGTERGYHRVPMPLLDPDASGGVRYERLDLHPGKIERAEDLQAIFGVLEGKLDSLSEMGEMESLRLQMAMDRVSKAMSTLSNLLKKASETSSTIVQNIK